LLPQARMKIPGLLVLPKAIQSFSRVCGLPCFLQFKRIRGARARGHFQKKPRLFHGEGSQEGEEGEEKKGIEEI